MESPFPEQFIEPSSVARKDQQLAAALDILRQAEHWVLLVPAPEEQRQFGSVAVMASADGPFMISSFLAYKRAIELVAAKTELEERGIAEEEAA